MKLAEAPPARTRTMKLWRMAAAPVAGDYVAGPLALYVVVDAVPIEHPAEDGWRCTVRRIGDTRGVWPTPAVGARVHHVCPCPDCPGGRKR